MPYYKSIRQLIVIFLLTFANHSIAAPNNPPSIANNSFVIKTAEIVANEDSYLLNSDVEVKFNTDFEEALNKGFEFNFLIEFQLVTPYKYWFDDEIVTVTNKITLSYHALSRQYLLVRGDQQKAFASLEEAKADLGQIRDLKVFTKNEVSKGEPYNAALLIRLDHSKLPKALLEEAESADEWKMISQRFEWVPNLFK